MQIVIIKCNINFNLIVHRLVYVLKVASFIVGPRYFDFVTLKSRSESDQLTTEPEAFVGFVDRQHFLLFHFQ